MKKRFLISYSVFLISYFILGMSETSAQSVGIGTTTPLARLHVVDSSVLFSATNGIPVSPGNPPIQGEGRRLMWYVDKAAFRVGYVFDNNWDKDSIGNYSIAGGHASLAKGVGSVALGFSAAAFADYAVSLGNFTVARGLNSTAFGNTSAASGESSTAFGYSSKSIGHYSTAMGANTNATGDYSTATGLATIAGGMSSFSMGQETIASGNWSTATGYKTNANGNYSIAGGNLSYTLGTYSFAMGNQCNTNGQSSIAMGHMTSSTAIASIALGQFTYASGNYSFALGKNVSTNFKQGAFFFGDSDPNGKGVRPIGFNDQFAARFNGGYYFISSDAASDIGVRVLAGGNSWVAISDENLKENFAKVDGEKFLEKISQLNLTTWNYKGQDPTSMRHYGPMAQEFFNAFGRDEIGTIGCDTLINQQDFLGVNLIAIQALEKRTSQLQSSVDSLRHLLKDIKEQNDALKQKIRDLEKENVRH